MAYTEVGRIRPRARGVYSTYSSYEVMDLVCNADQTVTYMAIKDVPAGTALSNTNYWVVFLNALEGPQGIQGEPGVSIETAAVNEDGNLIITLTDENTIDAGNVVGPQGEAFVYEDFTPEQLEALRGPEGPVGPQGQGITILGSYNSEDELNAAHPTGNAGDAYLIGGNLYVWSESTSTWENVGNIQGPKGDPGEITDEEKAEVLAELKSYVDTEILGGAW